MTLIYLNHWLLRCIVLSVVAATGSDNTNEPELCEAQ
jgi:hypothetical protein